MESFEKLKKQFKILVVGDSCLDSYLLGDCKRLSPEAPVPVFTLVEEKQFPGMAFNVANNLSGFGNEVKLYTNTEMPSKVRFIDGKSMQHLLRFDSDDEIKHITSETFNAIRNDIDKYDALIISDYNKGFLSDLDIWDLCTFALVNQVPIFADTKKNDNSCFHNAIIKINEFEFQNLLNLGNNCEYVVTMGAGGARWNDKHYEALKVNVFSVCGAGDSFLSGLIHSYLSTGDMDFSINFANRCGSIAVKNPYTHVINESDFNEL